MVGRRWTGYALLAPAVLVLLALVVYPTVFTFIKSLHYYQLFRPQDERFIGLKNFRSLLFSDQQFWMSLRLTVIFTVVAVGFELLIGLGLAALVFRYADGTRAFRAIFAIPMMMAPVVVSLIWRYMYDPSSGVINVALRALGLPAPNWLYDTSTALASIIIVDVWQWTPFVFVVLFAGMMALPRNVEEAARLDGAGYVQYVRYFMLPGLKPVILVVLLLRAIDAFKSFDQVYILTGGGPGTTTYLLSYYGSVIGFHNYNIGLAAALAILIMLMIAALTSVLLRVLGKELFA
jgi:multiple sugar transport system permease protein